MSQAPEPEAAAWDYDTQPSVPPGMYVDRKSGLTLPDGSPPASKGQVAATYALAVVLFIVTLGAGYLIWSVVTWGQGQTPAQRIRGLRCWHPETGRVADRGQMALRQFTGLVLNGQLLIGVWMMLSSMSEVSVGDIFAGTVVLRDPVRGPEPSRGRSLAILNKLTAAAFGPACARTMRSSVPWR
jgi:uncharacterized RDD family membrane protein YckC